MSAIDDVLGMNAVFAAAYTDRRPPRPPKKRLAVIACMDSRLDIYKMLGLAEGDAHAIRNAGGVVAEGTIRSLVISQRIGGTREVMLVHNTACGMVTFQDDGLKPQVESETGVEVPFEFHAFSDLEEQVRRSVACIRESLLLVHNDAVRGFAHDVHTGRLREVR